MATTLPGVGAGGICIVTRWDIQGGRPRAHWLSRADLIPGAVTLDVSALPLPPEARAVLRAIADEIRKPPAGAASDPIALRRWLDRIGRRLDGLAAIKAGGTPSPASVGRQGLANPRAALREQDRPPGIVVETRKRRGPE